MCLSLQIAFVAMTKLKNAVNFRQWTARGKGLVLLNILVSLWSLNVREMKTAFGIALCLSMGGLQWPLSSTIHPPTGSPLCLQLGGSERL